MSALNVRPSLISGLRFLQRTVGGLGAAQGPGNRKAIGLAVLVLLAMLLGPLFYLSEVKARTNELSLSWNIITNKETLEKAEYNIIPKIKIGQHNQFCSGIAL